MYGQRIDRSYARYLPPPPPPEPGAPNTYRFAEAGTLKAAIEDTGFRDVQEALHIVAAPWPGSAEERWQALVDVLPGLRRRMEILSAEQRAQLQQEVIAVIREDEDKERQQINLSSAIVIASARR
jgi:hypothetical protein